MWAATHVFLNKAKPRWIPKKTHVRSVLLSLFFIVLAVGNVDAGGRRCEAEKNDRAPKSQNCMRKGTVGAAFALVLFVVVVAGCYLRKRHLKKLASQPAGRVELQETHVDIHEENTGHDADSLRLTGTGRENAVL
jgi:hypothetical protein